MDGWDIYRWSRQDIHYKSRASKQDDANKAEPEPKSKEQSKPNQTNFEPGVDAVGKQTQGEKSDLSS